MLKNGIKKVCLIILNSLVWIILTSSTSLYAQRPLYLDAQQEAWVDSVMQTLSLEEKVGQLFMVAAYSNRNEDHYREIEDLIRDHHIGGLIFFQGGPGRQIHLTNRYQQASRIPLLIGMDLEWGLGMRLDSTISFPKQMTLGAIQDNDWIYDMGTEIALEMQKIGVHINFAPVVDVNSDPANPVIGSRSFGEDIQNVGRKGLAYMKGMQDNGILANAKHFPGHGDTGSDSHYTLPVINKSKAALDSIDLAPFKMLMDSGLSSVMVAHINIPALDDDPKRPTTLSRRIVKELLQDEIGFKGLIFTDAMNMQGVAAYYNPGDADLNAFMAGNDIMLFPVDVERGISTISRAVRRGRISETRLDQSVRKVLMAKYLAGLQTKPPKLSAGGIHQKLNSPAATGLKLQLFEQAMTVVSNEDEVIPLRNLESKTIASLSINAEYQDFYESLITYTDVTRFLVGQNTSASDRKVILDKLKLFDQVIIGLHDPSQSRRSFRVTEQDLSMIRELAGTTKVILALFGNPYTLRHFEDIPNVVCAYEEDPYSQRAAAEVIFGAIGATGRLPVTASGKFRAGHGIDTPDLKRMGWGTPEITGMDSRTLARLDPLIHQAIADTTMPGCQLLIAKDGRIIFNKSYGYFTYDSLEAVTHQTVYDVASITKVVATLQTVMFLEERGILDMDKKISVYLHELKGTNKENMILRDILTHQAGLWPYLPYWKQTLSDEGNPYYSPYPQENYTNQVAIDLYARNDLRDSVWHWTVESKLLEKEERKPYEYRYSDMGYYLLKRVCERYLNQPMADFLEQNFYGPLGMTTTCYLPLCRYSDDIVAPTEYDDYFRNTQIQGLVHDQGAALYGGVAGHAGIFSNATDLVKLIQMNLQDGYYGGDRYLLPGTIKRFASAQYETNRRGMGWDRPTGDTNGPTTYYASAETFGHTGFTGTAAWADPEFDLVYVFLSNRIYPDADNAKLIRKNIRTRIGDIIYESMWNWEKSNCL